MVALYAVGYRLARSLVLWVVFRWQAFRGQPKNLEPAIVFGDKALASLDKVAGPLLFPRLIKPNPVEIHDVRFTSPFTFAAFKDDVATLELWLKLGMGGGCFKTILQDPRSGNPQPRVQDLGENLINAYGLPGKGVDGFIEQLTDHPIFNYDQPLGASIGGNSTDEYLANIKALEQRLPAIAYYELNISCPNTPEGQDLMKNTALLADLLAQIRQHTDKVVGVKVSPDQPDKVLQEVGEMLQGTSKTYVNAGNTTFRKCTDVGLPADAISIGGGGMSGPALFPRTLEMTRLFSDFKVPILATGGISTRAHVIALQEAGASVFGLATLLVKNLYQLKSLS